MNARALVVLTLLTIPLAGCVIAGGVNYHFPNKPSPTGEKKCNPADKSADCARPAERSPALTHGAAEAKCCHAAGGQTRQA